MVQLPINFILVFRPYLSNAVKLRLGWFLHQNVLLNIVIIATPTMACNNDNRNFRYLGTSISPPTNSFVLEDFLADTSTL